MNRMPDDDFDTGVPADGGAMPLGGLGDLRDEPAPLGGSGDPPTEATEESPLGELQKQGEGDAVLEPGGALAAAEDLKGAASQSRRAVLGVPIEVVISVGRARPLLSDLVTLRRDSVLSLDSRIEDPVEIMVGGRVIARGELQEIDGEGRLGVRLTEVADNMSAR